MILPVTSHRLWARFLIATGVVVFAFARKISTLKSSAWARFYQRHPRAVEKNALSVHAGTERSIRLGAFMWRMVGIAIACRWILRIARISVTCILLTGSMSVVQAVSQTSSTKLSKPPRVLRQVVNRHFTVGKRIPSNYLKLFSDGTVECQEIDKHDLEGVKKTQMSRTNLRKSSPYSMTL